MKVVHSVSPISAAEVCNPFTGVIGVASLTSPLLACPLSLLLDCRFMHLLYSFYSLIMDLNVCQGIISDVEICIRLLTCALQKPNGVALSVLLCSWCTFWLGSCFKRHRTYQMQVSFLPFCLFLFFFSLCLLFPLLSLFLFLLPLICFVQFI